MQQEEIEKEDRKKMKKAIPAEMIQIPVAAALMSEQGDMEVSVR